MSPKLQQPMTPKKRVSTALNLGKPDRVPVVPNLTPISCAHLLNWPQAKIAADTNVALESMIKVYEKFGPFDGVNPAVCCTVNSLLLQGHKVKIPGKDLPEDVPWQMMEEEILKFEDYDKILEMGPTKFWQQELVFRTSNEIKTQQDVTKLLKAETGFYLKSYSEWYKRDTVPMIGGGGSHPFFVLSLTRSMVKFTEDLYYHPDKVEKVIARMAKEYVPTWIKICNATGVKMAFFCEERASAAIYPLRMFERFWWPYTKQMVDELWSHGIRSWFHLDMCWDKNLSYFLELPKGSAVIALDGTTDIFKAKEVLGGHLCIAGDVHPSLLSLGKPEDVKTYCEKLIDVVGGDGGFILSSGCEVPYACKPENLRAMVETGKNYEL